MHCRPDTSTFLFDENRHWYSPCIWLTNEKKAILQSIRYKTGMPYYQVNADWLYVACSTGKSQIVNLMPNCPLWNLTGNRQTNVQNCITWMTVLFPGWWRAFIVYLFTAFYPMKRTRCGLRAHKMSISTLSILQFYLPSECLVTTKHIQEYTCPNV